MAKSLSELFAELFEDLFRFFDRPPQANPDHFKITEDAGLSTIDVLANDRDPDRHSVLHVSSIKTAGLKGTTAISADGKHIVYDPGQAFQSLAAGQTATEIVKYTVADQFGKTSTSSVTITIIGVNDSAVLSSATEHLTEQDTASAISTGGTLTISDVDSPAKFVAQTAKAGSYGHFSINSDGAWSYAADSAHNEFAAGTTYTDKFTVSSVDGTTTSVTIKIAGTNDAAVLSSDIRNLTEGDTAAAISSSGHLTISDVDSPALFVAQSNKAGSYGHFSIDSSGAWTYVADSAHNEFAPGVIYNDVFTVTSVDGTATSVTINILGTDEAPVLTPGHDGSSGPMSGGKFFLLIDGVDGGSTDKDHVGWFEIDSFNFDVTNTGSGGTGAGGGSGTALFFPLTVGLALPSSLTDLLSQTATGRHLDGVRIEGVTSGDHAQAFYDLTLTNVSLSKTHEQNSGGDVLTFANYDKIFLTTHGQKPDGSLAPAETFGWDVKANKADAGTAPALTPGHDGSSGPITGGKYFLLIDGVDGGSKDADHVGWFEIDSFDIDATNTGSSGTGGGGGAGKVSFSPLTVGLAFPSSLTDLLAQTATGRHLDGVRIEGVTSGDHPQAFYDLTLTNVSISKTHEQNGGGDVLTFDNYDKIFLETHGQGPDGSLAPTETFGWNVKTNTAEDGTAPALTPGHDGSSGPIMGGKYFLLIDGIDGGSTDKDHLGWFEIDNFKFDATNLGSGGTGSGGGAGKVAFSPLTVGLALPSSLTELLAQTATGDHLDGVRIEGVKSGDHSQAFYDLTLTNVSLTKTHEQDGSGDVLTFDNYDKIFLETHGQKPDGSLSPAETFGWDVNANKADAGTAPALTPGHDGASGPLAGGKYFLLIDGVDGGSTNKDHVGWFEIDGFKFDASNAGSGGAGSGGGAGKVDFSALTDGLTLPSSLTELLADTAGGDHLKGVTIEGVTSGDHSTAFYDLTLTNVSISGIVEQNGSGDVLTFDNYDKMFLETHGQNPDGSPAPAETFGWDVKANKTEDGTAPTLTPGHDGSSGPLAGGKYFLLIDGVDGGSTDKDHVGWFEIDSFNFDATNAGSGGTGSGGGVGKASFSPLTVGLALPSSLTDLLADTATGDHLKGIKIEGVTSGDHSKAFYDLTLTNVSITGTHEQNGGGDALTFDNYDKIFLATHGQTADGSPAPAETFGWDVKANKTDAGTAPVLAPDHDGASGPLGGGKYFLLVDGVDGGSTDKDHVGWFEIDRFNFNATNLESGSTSSGGGAGKVVFSPLTVDLALPSSLTEVLADTAGGEHLKGVKIEGVTSGDHSQAFYDLTLTNLTINQTHEQNGRGDVLTFDNYDKIFLETLGQTSDGSLAPAETFAWDVAKSQLIHNGFDLA